MRTSTKHFRSYSNLWQRWQSVFELRCKGSNWFLLSAWLFALASRVLLRGNRDLSVRMRDAGSDVSNGGSLQRFCLQAADNGSGSNSNGGSDYSDGCAQLEIALKK